MADQYGHIQVNTAYYHDKELFSDRDAEEEILAYLEAKPAEDLSAAIAEHASYHWLYHLSLLRGNLVRNLPMTDGERVLEVGCGCGTITGILAERAGEVTGIGFSLLQAKINACRNQAAENIRLYVGDFVEIEEEALAEYDLITLIDIAEYAPQILEGEDACRILLARLARHLAPGGRLVIAAPNRLGIKYFAGNQDVSGQYFAGIEGYPPEATARSYSKKEWTEMLKEAGFRSISFAYPYPDQRFPTQIYTDAYLPKEGELNNYGQNYDLERMELFDEEKVFTSLIENDLFPAFANAFLITAAEGEDR